jgi:hypothetical protein
VIEKSRLLEFAHQDEYSIGDKISDFLDNIKISGATRTITDIV